MELPAVLLWKLYPIHANKTQSARTLGFVHMARVLRTKVSIKKCENKICSCLNGLSKKSIKKTKTLLLLVQV